MIEKNEKKLLKEEIGKRLRIFRIHKKFSHQDICSHLGISRAELSRIEKGDVFPNIYALKILAKKFDISLMWLLLNEGDMFVSGSDRKKQNGVLVVDEELKSLLAYLSNVPELRHKILTLFYELRDIFNGRLKLEMISELPNESEPKKTP